MEDKKQDVNSLDELVKEINACSEWFASLADEISKVLADIKAPKQEDTWEMKCPYEYGDKHYCIQSSGDVFLDSWKDIEADNSFFSQGNIFPTREAAELEAKRRNLLTRFRAFRDECNVDWKPDWSDMDEAKWSAVLSEGKLEVLSMYVNNSFDTFGHFKNTEDCQRAIELFGEEIIELFVEV